MRCHNAKAGKITATYIAGQTIDVEWFFEAPHPGDCSLWLSYDTNIDSPMKWIKLKNFPGCLSPTGLDPPIGTNKVSIKLSEYLPSCDHCVLRFESYGVQLVSDVEFYVDCADIKIINNLNNNCLNPEPTHDINGIQHLLYNINDPKQKGCPFYNPYDSNIKPILETRYRGPNEWTPICNNLSTISPITTKSITTKPITTIPITTSPTTSKPITTSPITTSPITTKPTTTSSPITTKPITTKSITTDQITTSPITTDQITTSPITTDQITTSPITTSSQITTNQITTGPITTNMTTIDPFDPLTINIPLRNDNLFLNNNSHRNIFNKVSIILVIITYLFYI
jgi:hypothetical protein